MNVSDVDVVEDIVGGLETYLTVGKITGEERLEFIVERLQLSLETKKGGGVVICFGRRCHSWTCLIARYPDDIRGGGRQAVERNILISREWGRFCRSIGKSLQGSSVGRREHSLPETSGRRKEDIVIASISPSNNGQYTELMHRSD